MFGHEGSRKRLADVTMDVAFRPTEEVERSGSLA
jgi:hypothetical protein